MKIVTTFHQPSSVLHSVKCQLSSRDLEHLVVAKVNGVDVYSLQPHGLQHQCRLDVRGNISSLKSVPIPGSTRSNILVLLGIPEPELILLAYTEDSSGSAQLIVKKELSLFERIPRPTDYFTDVLVHPSGKLAVVSCYTGKLRIIRFKSGDYDQDFDVLLQELVVLSLAFLPLDDEFALAILHLDQGRVQLLSREILLEQLELSDDPSMLLTPTAIPPRAVPVFDDAEEFEFIPKIVPVPAQKREAEDEDDNNYLGGILVIGGKKILMYELASGQSQAKQKSKRRRLESKKKSADTTEAGKARDKEREREARNRKAQGSVDWPWSTVTAVCAVAPSIPRFFIGDCFGKLSMLSLERVKDQGLILIPLGEASPAKTLTYLSNQALYLGSHFGDSQLLQISPTPTSSTSPTLPIPPELQSVPSAKLFHISSPGKGKNRQTDEDQRDPTKGAIVESTGSFIHVLETYKNIAPILDAVLVDTDGSGERQILTCSGGGNKGSLNIVRNGADFQELATIPGVLNVTSVWGVRNQFADTVDSHIFVSTLDASYLFRINDTGNDTKLSYMRVTGIDEKNGLTTDLPTVAFGNVAHRVTGASGKASYENSQLVVQVTRKNALLLEYNIASQTFEQLAGWEIRGMEIVAASVNPSQVVLALSGGRLVALSIMEKDFHVNVDEIIAGLPEISTVSCTPLDHTKFFSTYVTVSYWGTNVVQVFVLDKNRFVSICKSHPLPALVRSVILFNFGSDSTSKGENYHPYLLVGLGDGSVAYFPWKEKQLNDYKIISLGHAPVSLSVCQVDGKKAIFAAGNRATVFSWEKKRLHSSPIMLKEIIAVSPLNTATFRSSLVFATSTGLTIGRVQDLDKLHIRSIPLGFDNPQRVVHEPHLKVFGVVITRPQPNRVADPVWSQSSFRLFDDNTFSTLANFNCEPSEQISAITSYSPVITGKVMHVFCVGVFTDAEEKEPSEGRLLVFSALPSDLPSKSLQMSVMASADVHGCVYRLTIVNDMIVAAVNSSVMLFKLYSSEDKLTPSCTLELLSEWNHNYLVTSLASYGDRIVAGDILASISLLTVVKGKLQNVARDYGPIWPVSIEASDEENIVGANSTANLFTFTLANSLGRSILECNGTYYLNDNVSTFIRGSLGSDAGIDDRLSAKHIFFTSTGAIGILVDVHDPQLSLHLTALQRNLAGVITGVGGTSFAKFRAPKNEKGRSDAEQESRGFLDGDFLEQFLAHLGSPAIVEKIVAGESDPERLTMTVKEMQAVLETLQSMH